MESKKISALLTAIELGSLTSAAEELGYTQSGMTHMMNALEEEMGLSLLNRSKSGVSLSPAGQALLPEMSAFVASARALASAAERLQKRGKSSLRIGAYSSVMRLWLPGIMSQFREENSEVDISIFMASTEELLRSVRNEEISCAFVSFHEALMSGLSWIPLKKDQLVAILPKGSWEGDSYPIENFEGKEFLMPTDGFFMEVEPLFTQKDHVVSPIITNRNLEDRIIISMVEHGLGSSILTEMIMQDMNADVQIVPLAPAAYRELGIAISEKSRSDRNIRQLIHTAKAIVSDM